MSDQPASKAGRWCWVCIKDPDGAFRGNHFSIEMVRAGGFEDGTVFRNSNTGEIKAWRNGVLVTEGDQT